MTDGITFCMKTSKNLSDHRLASECAKLDKLEEQSFADFGLFADSFYFDGYQKTTKTRKSAHSQHCESAKNSAKHRMMKLR